MVLDAVSNFVRGTADAAVGTSDTTVSVEDASIFPDPETDGEFNVVIWDANNFPRPDQDGDVEIMRVTARDTTEDELTVTRGQEMTSAAAHPEGSAIHLSPTAKMFSDIESTFGDFWDAETQELTADVNNTNTTTTALESDAVSTDDLGITDTIFNPSQQYNHQQLFLSSGIDETSSVSFVEIAEGSGFLTNPDIPNGARLYGRHTIRCRNDSDGETTTYRLFMRDEEQDSFEPNELNVTSTASETGVEIIDTGWTEITSSRLLNRLAFFRRLEAQVTGGVGETFEWGCTFAWRVE